MRHSYTPAELHGGDAFCGSSAKYLRRDTGMICWWEIGMSVQWAFKSEHEWRVTAGSRSSVPHLSINGDVNLFLVPGPHRHSSQRSHSTKACRRCAQKPRHDERKWGSYSWGDADGRFPKNKRKKIASCFADDRKYRADWMAFLKFDSVLKLRLDYVLYVSDVRVLLY